ncbi:MAG: pseudouridine synthase [Candidatus Obscuribacterales bacterium]|nr:pseudouridine synthase [Candidatus Obscuribacterales bacterium]
MPNFTPRDGFKYIAFFKPFGVLSQFSKEADSDKRTLADFDFPKEVYPIGRLDFDSEGLLLLSDDGRLNSALLEPRYGHRRTYYSQVERIPSPDAIQRLRTGVLIEGRKTQPAEAKLLDFEPCLPEREVPIRFRKNVPTAWIELILGEGKNRQVRRMTAAVGHPTLRLVRIAIGNLYMEDLDIEPGQWRLLSSEQLADCFR